MRWNWADQAVRGYGSSLSSMSRMASPSRVEVVLDAEQLERVLAVAIGQVGLQHAQAGDLAGDVPRVGDHRGQRNDQSQ